MPLRRTSIPDRRPSRISGGASTVTGSSGHASGTPRTVAADRPVITAPAGRASVAPRHRTGWVTFVPALT